MYYLIYKTTNHINGKIYIGCHQTNRLTDGYLGSGVAFKRALRKYGKENFKREILHIFDNPEDMFEMEATLVNEEFVHDKSTYNLVPGGKTTINFVNEMGLNLYGDNGNPQNLWHQPGQIKHHLIKTGRWDSYRKSLREALLRRRKEATDSGTEWWGKPHSEETKQKISRKAKIHQAGDGNSQYGTVWIHNIELEKNQKIQRDSDIPDGWVAGRVMDFKQKKEQLSQVMAVQPDRVTKLPSELDLQRHKARKLEEKNKCKEAKEQERYQWYSQWFEEFKKGNYTSVGDFIRRSDYPYSRQILIRNWRNYLKIEFKPGVSFSSEFVRNSIQK